MRSHVAIFLFSLLTLFACKRENESYNIKYQVRRLTDKPVSYRVIYSGSANATQQQGPIDVVWWDSDVVRDIEEGTKMSITIDVISGEGLFKVTIFRGQGEWEVEEIQLDSFRDFTLEKKI